MRRYLAEFKEFISKGDVVTIAVGLIIALYFAKIVDALLNGVINPIIAAIFGESNFTNIGFNIGDARISIGLVIDAAISFVVVAFILFLMIKAYNRYKGPAEPGGPTEAELLAEIRDELRAQRALPPPPPPR
jgi:large conductance mechanosensitive channel